MKEANIVEVEVKGTKGKRFFTNQKSKNDKRVAGLVNINKLNKLFEK